MKSTEVNFWLYADGKKVTGLYGMFCQFTDEPKIYAYSRHQVNTVINNLRHRLAHMQTHEGDSIATVLDHHSTEENKKIVDCKFDELRIENLEGEYLELFSIKYGEVFGKLDVEIKHISKPKGEN